MALETKQRWAWVAGASEGVGLAFAEELAGRGYSLVLFARRSALLAEHAARIRTRHRVAVLERPLDLAALDLADRLSEDLLRAPPQLAVYNAAFAPVSGFLDQSLEDLARVVAVNVHAPLVYARVLGQAMARHGGGGLILMSSLAGEQGSPGIAAYSASKAFNTRLAEALWAELDAVGVNVVVCCAGAIRTPGYEAATSRPSPGLLEPDAVVRATLDRLGHGPRVVPGLANAIGALLLGRLLPRAWGIRIMQRITRALTPSVPGTPGG
jgi:short-subunit dehydrogenase